MKKTGFFAIVGKPNVGKSTIINNILGEKISIVSSKPQTTRTRITGILTRGDDQFIFLDTPGFHNSKTKLGKFMNKSASSVIGDVDACVLVVEAEPRIGVHEKNIIERVSQNDIPCILVINKTDKSNAGKIAQTIQLYAEQYDFASVIPVCALKNDGTDIIIDECSKFLYEQEHLYPDDIVTDQPERQIAAEIIREKVLRSTEEEIPHGVAVVIEEFEDLKTLIRIRAEIICEKNSHKGILIGKNGDMMKQISTWAREDMEKFFGVKVYLNTWVKVKENWRDNNYNLNNFGFNDKDI